MKKKHCYFKDHSMGKEKAFQTMSSMTSAQLISCATAKGLTLNSPCIPPYTVSTHTLSISS